jgi:hypothetical protein
MDAKGLAKDGSVWVADDVLRVALGSGTGILHVPDRPMLCDICGHSTLRHE